MPYSGKDDDNLPEYVKKLSDGDKEKWVSTFNSSYQSCIDDGGDSSSCEGEAFAIANGTVKDDAMDEERTILKKIYKLLVEFVKGDEGVSRAAVSSQTIWEALSAHVSDEYGYYEYWPIDMFVEDSNLYFVLTKDGKLYKMSVSSGEDGTVNFGDYEEVVQEFTPVEQRTSIVRQSDGRVRITTVAGTAVVNRVGEIDSTAMYDSFLRHMEDTGEYPIVNVYHLGSDSKVGQVDFAFREGYLYVVSYLLDDTPIGRAIGNTLLSDEDAYFGHSIEFSADNPEILIVGDGVEIPVYTNGVNTAVSICTERIASSLFTAKKVGTGVQRMNEAIKKDLVKLLGGDEDLADEFIGGLTDANRTILDSGMVARTETEEVTEEATEEVEETIQEVDSVVESEEEEEEEGQEEETVESDGEEEEDDPVNQETLPDIVVDESVVRAVTEHILTSGIFTEAQERTAQLQEQMDAILARINEVGNVATNNIRGLNQRLEALEKPEEQKRRDFVAKLPAQKQTVVYRPSNGVAKSEEGDIAENFSEMAQATLSKWSGHE